MASSLIGGLIAKGVSPNVLRASDPVEENRNRLAEQFGIATSDDNAQICKGAKIIVLAVKPQILREVAQGIASCLEHCPVVVSIAAGIPIVALQAWLNGYPAIVRCMPNTPALVGVGASGLYATPQVSIEQKNRVEEIFAAVGSAVWLLKEQEIDAVTALSGSGPAYFFLFMEAMESAGIALGLEPSTARQLTLQTALGAATMASQSEVDNTELRRRVTSPGGTTEQAILSFQQGGLSGLVKAAMAAAHKRAGEMADEFSR